MSAFDPLLFQCPACDQPPGYYCIPDYPLRTEPRVGYIHPQRIEYNQPQTDGRPATHEQWNAAVLRTGMI